MSKEVFLKWLWNSVIVAIIVGIVANVLYDLAVRPLLSGDMTASISTPLVLRDHLTALLGVFGVVVGTLVIKYSSHVRKRRLGVVAVVASMAFLLVQFAVTFQITNRLDEGTWHKSDGGDGALTFTSGGTVVIESKEKHLQTRWHSYSPSYKIGFDLPGGRTDYYVEFLEPFDEDDCDMFLSVAARTLGEEEWRLHGKYKKLLFPFKPDYSSRP